MQSINATTRVTFGLVCLTLCMCLLADTLGILPDPAADLFESRRRLSEAVAVHCSLLVADDDQKRLEALLHTIQQRDSKLRSVVVRRADGEIYAAAGNHLPSLPSAATDTAADVMMQVPIIRGVEDWGRVEVQFLPTIAPGVMGWFQRPLVRLVIFMTSASCLLCFGYLRTMLEYLDPCKVIPIRVGTALDTLAEGLIVVDRYDRIMFANNSFATTLETSPESLIGRRASSLNWEALESGSTHEPYPWVRSIKEGNRLLGCMLTLKGADGKRTIFKINTSPIVVDGNKPRGAFVSFNDVTLWEEKRAEMRVMLDTLSRSRDEIRRHNRKLETLATRDPLTSCLNRRTFFQEVETHWSSADQFKRELSCLMLDVDHFKSINDNRGHRVGDLVLQKVGEILHSNRRDCDLVCRYGGEEFCILLPTANTEDATAVGESIRLAIEAAVFDDVRITVSIGVSSRSLGARDFQEMIDEADQCLYVAKRNGRNQVVRWDEFDEYPVFNNEDSTKDGAEGETDGMPLVGPREDSIPFHAVTALVSALGYRDPTTADHSRRVADLCAATAEGLMSQRDIFVLETAGMLHDIGKIGVPDAILLKKSELTEDEWQVMRRNERIGAEIIQTTFASRKLAENVRMYRAWYGGHPRHPELPIGDKIPLGARILAIADAYDSMVNDRGYRKGRSRDEAFDELRSCAIKQFDPDLVERFVDVVTLKSSEGESFGESKAVVLNLGIQIERLADAMEKQDVIGIGALASRMNMAAVKHGLNEVAETAGKLEAAVAADSDLAVLVGLTNDLMGICQSAQQAYLDPTERLQASATALAVETD